MSEHEQAIRRLVTDLLGDHASNATELDDDYLREVLADDEGVPAGDLDEAVARTRHLMETAVITVTLPGEDDGWEPGRWYRIRRPDGTLWMETSSGGEARHEAEKTGWPLEQLYVKTQTEWRSA